MVAFAQLILFSSCFNVVEENASTDVQIENKPEISIEKTEKANSFKSYKDFINSFSKNEKDQPPINELQFKTNQALESDSPEILPTPELLSDVPAEGDSAEIEHGFALGFVINTDYLELGFDLEAEDVLYIPIKKYCLNQNGLGFHLCKYNAVINWGDGRTSIVSNYQSLTNSYGENLSIQHSQVDDNQYLTHTYSSQDTYAVRIHGQFEGLGKARQPNSNYKEKLNNITVQEIFR